MTLRLTVLTACSALLAACASSTDSNGVEDATGVDDGTGGSAGRSTMLGGDSGAPKGDAKAGTDARGAGGSTAVGGSSGSGGSSTTPVGPLGDCSASGPNVLRVCNAKTGVSLKYNAVSPGRYSTQNVAYIDELGIKWLRGWIGFEGRATPFDGKTIAEVKANPNVLDYNAVGSWAGGSSWYQWAAENNAIYCPVFWWFQGTLQASTTCDQKEYAFDVTPGSKDENLMWVATFGLAYWANVVNRYNLVALDMINEPDNCGGNGGTENTVVGTSRQIQIASDALRYVNQTLVSPPKDAIVSGPGVLSWWNGKAWLDDALNDKKTYDAISKISFHSYYAGHWWDEIHDAAAYINGITGGAKKMWITEWGQWWYADGYGTPEVAKGMATVIAQLGQWNIELASPWQLNQSSDLENGLVRTDGSKTELYWLTKMLGRALLSEKDMIQTSSPNASAADTTFAWVTRDATDMYVIYMNNAASPIDLTVDLSAFSAAEGKTVNVWRVGPGASTGEIADPDATVSGGSLKVKATADTSYVMKINGAAG